MAESIDSLLKEVAGPTGPTLEPQKTHLGPTFKHEHQLIRARFSPDGKLIAAAGLDKIIHIWELESGQARSLGGHATWISSLAFNPKDGHLFSADFHGTIRCWDCAGAGTEPLFTITGADANVTRALVVTTDGAHLLSGGDDGVVRKWSTKDGAKVAEWPGHKGGIYSLAVHPSEGVALSGDLFGVVKQWDVATGKVIREIDAKPLHTRKDGFLADVGGVRTMAFDAAGGLLACGGLNSAESASFCPGIPMVVVFDWKSGKQKQQLKLANKSDGPINGVRFLSDGTLAGYGETQNGAPTELAFWKPEKAEPFQSLKGQSAYDLDVHPDGLRLLAPLFVPTGSGGNGARKSHLQKYLPNAATVQIFNLFADPKPAATKKGKA